MNRLAPKNVQGYFSTNIWTIFCYKKLLFPAQFRNNICAISVSMQTGPFLDEPEVVVCHCRMKFMHSFNYNFKFITSRINSLIALFYYWRLSGSNPLDLSNEIIIKPLSSLILNYSTSLGNFWAPCVFYFLWFLRFFTIGTISLLCFTLFTNSLQKSNNIKEPFFSSIFYQNEAESLALNVLFLVLHKLGSDKRSNFIYKITHWTEISCQVKWNN